MNMHNLPPWRVGVTDGELLSPSETPDITQQVQLIFTPNDIGGWMGDSELCWLENTASGMSSVLEIGVWKGRSTFNLLTGCNGTVTAVDHFLGSASEQDAHSEAREVNLYDIFMANVGHFDNLVVLKMDSIEASKLYEDKSIDMIFIDGDHEELAFEQDIIHWLPKAKKMICGHDRGQAGVPVVLPKYFDKVEQGPDSIWYVKLE